MLTSITHLSFTPTPSQIDKEGADPQKVLTGLMSYDILTEEFGGQVQCAKVSAKSGEGIEELLEKVLLQVSLR